MNYVSGILTEKTCFLLNKLHLTIFLCLRNGVFSLTEFGLEIIGRCKEAGFHYHAKQPPLFMVGNSLICINTCLMLYISHYYISHVSLLHVVHQ